ncbi:MAG: hypothetical protein JOZ41_19810, partial [Chloroflexi bacterium]|nr:hypothetical protein [Chloroflexota bacterium]
VTGEDFDLESAIRHYPLVALGVAAGLGAVGGWWLGRRSRPQLPAPQPKSQLESTFESLRDLGSRLAHPSPGDQGHEGPLGYLEQLVPEGLETVRKALPELTSEETISQAKTWFETVVEPKLKEGLDNVVSQSRVGSFLKDVLRQADTSEETHLPDPEDPDARSG